MQARRLVFVLALLLCTISCICALSVEKLKTEFVVNDVERTIDVTDSAQVKVDLKLQATNKAASTSAFYLALTKAQQQQLAFLEVKQIGNDENSRIISSKALQIDDAPNSDAVLVEVPFDAKKSAATEGQKLVIKLRLVFSGQQEAVPAEISQQDNQKLLFKDSAYVYLPYEVKKQTTTISVGTQSVDSFVPVQPSDRRGEKVVYGPYDSSIAPLRYQPISVHYQNNKPYGVITKAERLLEISHWGNLAVEESYEWLHAGAKLKGGFSRLDYQRSHFPAPSSFNKVTASLPVTAADIYYRDRIGNISTSVVRESNDKRFLEVDFFPRFPLFGGWKIPFYMGYNVPVSQFLNVDEKGQFQFKSKFFVPFKAPVEDLTVRVVLPEGASNVKVSMPFDVDSESREVLKTYLDVTGRTVVVLNKKNVVPEHDKYFTVSYDFPAIMILRKPMVVISGLLAFCLFVIGYVRLTSMMSIGRTEAQVASANKEKAQDHIETYYQIQLDRDALYKKAESAISKQSQNAAGAEAELKKVRDQRAEVDAKVRTTVLDVVKKLDTDTFNELQRIETLEQQKFDMLSDIANLSKEVSKSGVAESAKRSKTQQLQEKEKQYDRLTDQIFDAVARLSS